MEIGIDSFAAAPQENITNKSEANAKSIAELIERIEFADQMGLSAFGIGEHHREEFLDSANAMILAAAASRTKQIKLTSAVTVISAADPVRVFQQYATLDLITKGRAEIVVGRGSFTEAFPLFGYRLSDYNELFEEKLELLLEIVRNETVSWKGNFRPGLRNQTIYPRPYQTQLPVWVGVGGTPNSFVRAGHNGLPLMLAVIGGQTHKYASLVELYRQSLKRANHDPKEFPIGLHSFGFVGKTRKEALDTFFPGYQRLMTKIGFERNWAPMTWERFEAQTDDLGAIVIGSAEEVATKLERHSKALGGIKRFNFQLDVDLAHDDYMTCIELIGKELVPLVKDL